MSQNDISLSKENSNGAPKVLENCPVDYIFFLFFSHFQFTDKLYARVLLLSMLLNSTP